MITHITVEDAAKLISWVSNMNKTEALIYISEAADRGEIQGADALEKLQAELEQVKRERDAALDCIYKIEDALDRGNDNDWAREHISEWESQKEG